MKTFSKRMLRTLAASLFIGWSFYRITILYLIMTSNSLGHTKQNISSNTLKRINPQFINNLRDVKQLWIDDKYCNRYNVKFGKKLPTAFLVSFPRSGNTWLRYLIEAATGVFTGSVYGSRNLLKLGYLGEREDPLKHSVIIVKTHLKDFKDVEGPSLFNSTAGVVLLIRNPEDSIISMWNYLHSNYSFFSSVSTNNKSSEFEIHIYKSLKHWKKLQDQCLKFCKNLLVIFYEELVKFPAREVKKIVEFLGFKPNVRRLKCIRKHHEGPAKRKHPEALALPKKLMESYKTAVADVIRLTLERNMEVPKEYENYIK